MKIFWWKSFKNRSSLFFSQVQKNCNEYSITPTHPHTNTACITLAARKCFFFRFRSGMKLWCSMKQMSFVKIPWLLLISKNQNRENNRLEIEDLCLVMKMLSFWWCLRRSRFASWCQKNNQFEKQHQMEADRKSIRETPTRQRKKRIKRENQANSKTLFSLKYHT